MSVARNKKKRTLLYVTSFYYIVIYPPISVGMKVKRGPDWKWDYQDGGVGFSGFVVDIKDWKGEPEKGVRS